MAQASPPRIASRGWLLFFVLLAVFTELLLIVPLRTHAGSNIVALELAPSAAAFAEAVRRDWAQDVAATPARAEAPCGLGLPPASAPTAQPHLGKLRCNLWVDSLGLVPAYVGLLVIFTLAFAAPGTPALHRLVLCLPALAAGLADLLENARTLRALDLLATPAWTDATMAAVRQASQAKWVLLALALAVLGHRAWHAAGSAGRGQRRAAALLCLAAALALPVGASLWQPGIALGMAALVLALALLAWRLWQAAR